MNRVPSIKNCEVCVSFMSVVGSGGKTKFHPFWLTKMNFFHCIAIERVSVWMEG